MVETTGKPIHEDEESYEEDSDEDERDDTKSNEEESDKDKESDEKEPNDEEPKEMELPYQIKRFSFETAGKIIHEDEESYEEDSNDNKPDEDKRDDTKSNEEESDKDNESDEDKRDDTKSNEEESDKDNESDEKEPNDEEPKDMELPYQIKRFSFEISLKCSNNMNPHSTVIYFLKMLSTYSWEAKLLMMLAAFSLNFGEFSLVHGHKGLAGKLAILKGSESQVMPMVTHFIKSILHLTECIVELAQSSSHNSSPIIPIACYWIVTSVLTYASYFTCLTSVHSGCFIAEETQLSSLIAKIKDVISDCHPILEKKREEDSYKALWHAFFDENPISSTNLDVFKLVFNVKKGGKKKPIYDGYTGEMDHQGRMVHHNAMHVVLMRVVDICERMSGGVKSRESIIPLLQNVLKERTLAVRDMVPDIDRKIEETASKMDRIMLDWLYGIQEQIQNPVYSNIFTSEKEKDLWKTETWCTKLLVGVLGRVNTEWVEENMDIFLIGGNNIKWVKTFVSNVMLQIRFNPESEIKMAYVGSNMNVASMIKRDKVCEAPDESLFFWFFWARLRSIFLSRIKFLDETHCNEECDEIVEGLKKMLAYEAKDLAVDGWAMLCKGNKIVVCDLGDKMLTIMNEYDKWKESAIAKGFDQAFKDHHKLLDSTYTSQHHPRCVLEYPSNFDKVPENIKCPQCCHNMQKCVTFMCYHDKLS